MAGYSRGGDDNNDQYGGNGEFNVTVHRQSGQDGGYVARKPRDEPEGYGGHTSAYAPPSESYGRVNQEYGQSNDEVDRESSRHNEQGSGRYVNSRHERKHSTDSNSSKSSHKKHHSKSKHKHNTKSQSRSRERGPQYHGQPHHDQRTRQDVGIGV